MMLSSQGENTKAFVQPRIKEITMELLKIIRETENDDLTTVMQKIVCSYTEQLIPVAEQMCLNLVKTFGQVLEKDDNDEKAYGSASKVPYLHYGRFGCDDIKKPFGPKSMFQNQDYRAKTVLR